MLELVFQIRQQERFRLFARHACDFLELRRLLLICFLHGLFKAGDIRHSDSDLLFFLFELLLFLVEAVLLLNQSSFVALNFIAPVLNFPFQFNSAFVYFFLGLKQTFPFFAFAVFHGFADESLSLRLGTSKYRLLFFFSGVVSFFVGFFPRKIPAKATTDCCYEN